MQPQRRSPGMFAWLVAFVVVLLLVLFAFAARSEPADSSGDLALVGGKVYPTPQAVPIKNAVVLIHDGKIAAVGKDDDIEIPKSAYIIECGGRVITAGFWNSHVHFTEDVWKDAATAPAAKLEEHMQTMLTKWGDTTVFDIGSIPAGHARVAPPRGERRDSRPEDLHHRGSDLSRERHSGLSYPKSWRSS